MQRVHERCGCVGPGSPPRPDLRHLDVAGPMGNTRETPAPDSEPFTLRGALICDARQDAGTPSPASADPYEATAQDSRLHREMGRGAAVRVPRNRLTCCRYRRPADVPQHWRPSAPGEGKPTREWRGGLARSGQYVGPLRQPCRGCVAYGRCVMGRRIVDQQLVPERLNDTCRGLSLPTAPDRRVIRDPTEPSQRLLA